MSAFNPTTAYGNNAAQTQNAQRELVRLNRADQRAILSGEGNRQDIRQSIFAQSALLASIRQFASWILQQQKANNEAAKETIELAKV